MVRCRSSPLADIDGNLEVNIRLSQQGAQVIRLIEEQAISIQYLSRCKGEFDKLARVFSEPGQGTGTGVFDQVLLYCHAGNRAGKGR